MRETFNLFEDLTYADVLQLLLPAVLNRFGLTRR